MPVAGSRGGRALHVVFLACCAAGAAGPLTAQQFDSVTVDTIAPGVIHRHLVANAGPWNVHVVEVQLQHPGISVVAARALGELHGRETVSAIAHRNTGDTSVVLAAVNGDFFNLETGENENNQVIGGEVWEAVSRTLADSARYLHSEFAMLAGHRPAIARAWLIGSVDRRGRTLYPLDGINERRHPGSRVLYTARFGELTPPDSTGTLMELRLKHLRARGDTLRYRVMSQPVAAGSTLLATGPVLSVPRSDSGGLLPAVGDTLTIVPGFVSLPSAPRLLLGGWPRLLLDGENVAASADQSEGTTPAFSVTRHPRTGVGFSRDSSVLYLVTVDGRQESSSGMSLVEFATLLQSIGAYEALNLDGGGSTTMVIGGKVVNHPSDPGGERTVGDALLIMRRRR